MGTHDTSRSAAGRQQDGISLLHVWPDIAEALAPEERPAAERALIARLLAARDEDLSTALAAAPADVIGFALVAGVVLKETTLHTRSALELLGPGDVLAPPLSDVRQLESRAVSRYLALGDVSVAALGGHFKRVAARWPQVSDFLHARLAEQAHRASMHLAMLHLPRAEDRISCLFSDLAERFGRVTADGIVIDLPLTHDLIGRLIGSRRPTVSLALQVLHDEGSLSKRDDNRWKLNTDRPPP